jgi:septum formation protein
MLEMLRDSGTHKVFTAVACMAPLESLRDPEYALETQEEETSVRFDHNGASTLPLHPLDLLVNHDSVG